MKSIPFFLLLIMTMGLAGLEKLFGGAAPTWFLDQFRETVLDVFPGALTASFFLIAILETLTALLLTIGLVRKESFQNSSANKLYLKYGIYLAQLTFIALGFGQRLTHKHDSAGSLFFYAALTFIAGHIALADDSKCL
jgi:hypothetical protein